MPFFSPRFPHLRLPIHTGFDYADKAGMVPLSDCLADTGDLESVMSGGVVDGSTPLMGELQIGGDGVPTGVGKAMSNEDVVQSGAWPEFSKVLKKEYSEVAGVGVVF